MVLRIQVLLALLIIIFVSHAPIYCFHELSVPEHNPEQLVFKLLLKITSFYIEVELVKLPFWNPSIRVFEQQSLFEGVESCSVLDILSTNQLSRLVSQLLRGKIHRFVTFQIIDFHELFEHFLRLVFQVLLGIVMVRDDLRSK